MGFKCLAHCVRNYAQTHSTDSDLAARLGKLLDPAVGALRKGTIAQHPAHLRVMRDLCVECMSYAPLYFTQLLVLLLHHEMWECVSEGVRATIDVMIRSAARLSQASLVDVVRLLFSFFFLCFLISCDCMCLDPLDQGCECVAGPSTAVYPYIFQKVLEVIVLLAASCKHTERI